MCTIESSTQWHNTWKTKEEQEEENCKEKERVVKCTLHLTGIVDWAPSDFNERGQFEWDI